MQKLDLKILNDLGITFLEARNQYFPYPTESIDFIIKRGNFYQVVPGSVSIVYDPRYKCSHIIRTDVEIIKAFPKPHYCAWNNITPCSFVTSQTCSRTCNIFPIIATNSKKFITTMNILYGISCNLPIFSLKRKSRWKK